MIPKSSNLVYEITLRHPTSGAHDASHVPSWIERAYSPHFHILLLLNWYPHFLDQSYASVSHNFILLHVKVSNRHTIGEVMLCSHKTGWTAPSSPPPHFGNLHLTDVLIHVWINTLHTMRQCNRLIAIPLQHWRSFYAYVSKRLQRQI